MNLCLPRWQHHGQQAGAALPLRSPAAAVAPAVRQQAIKYHSVSLGSLASCSALVRVVFLARLGAVQLANEVSLR